MTRYVVYECRTCHWSEEVAVFPKVCGRCQARTVRRLSVEEEVEALSKTIRWCDACQKMHTP